MSRLVSEAVQYSREPEALNALNKNNSLNSSVSGSTKTVGLGGVTHLTERVFPRLRMKAEYQVCIGFDQIFSCLSSMEDGWCSSEQKADEARIETLSHSPEGELLRFSSYEEVMANITAEDSDVASVDVIDVSAGGFCLEIDPEKVGYPKIGDVLGVREHSRSEWKICVIRWSRPSSDGSQIGVELLAPSAYKTLLRDIHTEAVVSPAVFIPGIPLVGLPDSVLLPQNRAITNGDKALVRRHGDDVPCMMDKTGLITGSVKRMFISEVETSKQLEKTDIATSDIWATF